MGVKNGYDFSGWATKNDLLCSDGRIIRHNAFADQDGEVVPLVWNHRHNDGPVNVLGHALLENRPEGVYTYGYFNDTQAGQDAKTLVVHGDITSLSIWANKLQQRGSDVLHGSIKEVSLVMAGANPGAFIDSVLAHGDDFENEEAVIYTGEEISLCHSEDVSEKEEMMKDNDNHLEHADEGKEKTVQDVIDSMTEEQKNVMYAIVGAAVEDAKNEGNVEHSDDEEGEDEMRHNLFDNENQESSEVLTHAEMIEIITDAKRCGSLKESMLQHGIENIEYLFPDAKNVTTTPEFIKREDGWVTEVMNGVHHTPFSRVKSTYADITGEDARARGYVKGNMKLEEIFTLLKRTTDPQTVYKKQKLDRDDVIDITDFDIVSWVKLEMRGMLNEELAGAFLVGDRRLASSDDKIKEDHIRPIWKDADLYTIKATVGVPAGATDDQTAKAFIRQAVKSRKNYKGSGSPILFTTEDVLTDCLLLEDLNGRIIYDSIDKLATAMRVRKIVTVPIMENLTRVDSEGKTRELMGIIVNLTDYNVGADKGGAVNMFDDFDIDYNAQKYLIETRCSGALIKPYSAIALEKVETAN